jgi:hypothetical protein
MYSIGNSTSEFNSKFDQSDISSPNVTPQIRQSHRSSEWVEVTPAHPCEICGGGTWCGRKTNGEVVSCRRVSVSPVYGKGKASPDRGGLKYLFFPKPGSRRILSREAAAHVVERPDVTRTADDYAPHLSELLLVELGERLGVPAWALRQFPRLGWMPRERCWTMPMVDDRDRIIGLNRRYRSAKKKNLRGTGAGLYVGPDWRDRDGTVYIVEGFSDVATLTAAGLSAIGRPSDRAGVEYLAGLLAPYDHRAIVVIGERDGKPDGRIPGRSAASRVPGGGDRADLLVAAEKDHEEAPSRAEMASLISAFENTMREPVPWLVDIVDRGRRRLRSGDKLYLVRQEARMQIAEMVRQSRSLLLELREDDLVRVAYRSLRRWKRGPLSEAAKRAIETIRH